MIIKTIEKEMNLQEMNTDEITSLIKTLRDLDLISIDDRCNASEYVADRVASAQRWYLHVMNKTA